MGVRDQFALGRDAGAPEFDLRRLIVIAHHRFRMIRCLLPVLVLFCSAPIRAEPVRLASGGKAAMPIVMGDKASVATRDLAKKLAAILGTIAGAEFAIETGDGNRGIVLGTASEFAKLPFATKFGSGPLETEDYLLRSTPGALYLVGAGDLAVSHAVWDLLHRLGYRQFFPGETWEVVPKTAELSIDVEARERPSFHARRIWYNWGLWGYNDEPYRQWCVRNRAVKGLPLESGHSYEAIIAGNREEFAKHPEYLAEIAGRRVMRGEVKFCIGNADLRRLVVKWAVEQMKAHPERESISMDPSDGGGWCECEACAKLGRVSDRVVTLANEVAVAINDLGLGPKYVGFYAYNQHCAPPSIRLDPHVIPSATTAFLTGGFSFDQVLAGWKAKSTMMGVYDYLSVVDWDWNLPRGAAASRPRRVADLLAHIHEEGVRFYDAEAGDCWGPCGLGYYVASRVMWDVREAKNVDVIVADFLEKAFGSAREPMREFYTLITEDTQRRSPSDTVGRMYRHLAAARAVTKDAKVLRRINDLILYTRHAELYYAFANGGGSKDEVARHSYRIRRTMMVHTYGLWSRLLSQRDALTEGHPLKNEEPYSAAEIARMLEEGIAKNVPVDPGFAGVEFSKDLVPAAAALKFPETPPGNFPDEAQDRQRYYLWVPAGGGAIDLKVTVERRWAHRTPKLELFSPLEVSLDPVATREDYLPDGQERLLTLTTPHPGLHRLETYDGGDMTHITWPKGMPVSVESGLDTPDITSHFRGPWTLYFYVPCGTKIVGGWASRVANWAPKISGRLLAPDGTEMLDFGKREDGFFKVDVPAGADGALWKFENSLGQRLLMTVPPYLARSGDELLLPREVIAADANGPD
ncbi:MAG: DUF4838 domain-containing protein, partial [Chthoniobacteraceae bacterium]